MPRYGLFYGRLDDLVDVSRPPQPRREAWSMEPRGIEVSRNLSGERFLGENNWKRRIRDYERERTNVEKHFGSKTKVSFNAIFSQIRFALYPCRRDLSIGRFSS